MEGKIEAVLPGHQSKHLHLDVYGMQNVLFAAGLLTRMAYGLPFISRALFLAVWKYTEPTETMITMGERKLLQKRNLRRSSYL